MQKYSFLEEYNEKKGVYTMIKITSSMEYGQHYKGKRKKANRFHMMHTILKM